MWCFANAKGSSNKPADDVNAGEELTVPVLVVECELCSYTGHIGCCHTQRQHTLPIVQVAPFLSKLLDLL